MFGAFKFSPSCFLYLILNNILIVKLIVKDLSINVRSIMLLGQNNSTDYNCSGRL